MTDGDSHFEDHCC